MSKTSALSVAGRFIDNSFSENIALTNMQLQKMVYIANGFYLALTGHPLIREEIKVWDYGPVIESLYYNLREYGSGVVKKNLLSLYNEPIPDEPDINTVLKFTWDACKKVNGIQLSNWTHNEDSPWTKAKAENLTIIPNNYMIEFFSRFITED